MTLQAASTSQETCRSLGAKSFADKAVSTEDLRMASPPPPQPPQPPLVNSVVANELLRLETAISAMMAATENDFEDFQPRRPRSHSHHCFFQDPAAVHPRRCRRSASAMIILQPKYGGRGTPHVPHPGCCLSPCSVEVAEEGAAGPSSSRGSSHKTRKKRRKVIAEQVGGARPRKRPPVDPDELSKRARWTIVATACLLFFMCFLLVGITLRMTPIIDEMVRKENEQLMNSLNRAELESDVAAAVANDAWNSTIAVDPESSPAPLDLQDSKNVSHPSTGD
ncbi:uncharacterized protein LOC132203490 [Neocloeon triangulifer]|uniref:uncharacterized protein LOC132203490 n=1 Tax=Neocloeon triangulifer TaxID=2078957 RepID=UPI00286F3E8D|nr:uncharacterized protein LOC132203490 [Neocloeon triangulifer]